MALFRKSRNIPYDPALQEPAVRRSICTGEMTVGFIDRQSGKFTDVMKVEDQKGLEEFMRSVGVTEIKTIY